MATKKRSLKTIVREQGKAGLIKPNTLADVQRLAYGMNTRVKVDTASVKHARRCDLKCIHGLQPGKGTVVGEWNSLRVLLCGSCLTKVKAGAMIVSMRHAKAHAAHSAADWKKQEADIQRARDAKQLTRAAFRRKYDDAPKGKAAGAGR